MFQRRCSPDSRKRSMGVSIVWTAGSTGSKPSSDRRSTRSSMRSPPSGNQPPGNGQSNMRKILLTLAAIVALAPRGDCAPIIITYDPGGIILEFVKRYNDLHVAKEHVVIDGACISACTLITGLIDDSRVCITDRARLAFHSATNGSKFTRRGS